VKRQFFRVETKKKAKTCRDKLKVVTAGQKIAARLRKKAYLRAIAFNWPLVAFVYDGLEVKRNEREGN